MSGRGRFPVWQAVLGASFLAASAIVYWIHYIVFRDLRNLVFYTLMDVAFVFVQVLLVTMILNGLMSWREKMALLNKLNMVIGAFFSEAGTAILVLVSSMDHDSGKFAERLVVTRDWSAREFAETRRAALFHTPAFDTGKWEVGKLKVLLESRREFLLGLLGNPNLMEHESFTNTLWALFHLTEELAHRHDLSALSEADRRHLAEDLRRAYVLLLAEWLSYMEHLKKDYPYLFSFAMRTNPFDRNAKVELK